MCEVNLVSSLLDNIKCIDLILLLDFEFNLQP